ncbi:glycoside hydrolase family 28 protein [Portibacter lacus]|uniref:Polygalacturonase n=1 Tax=Portibacter lacus TaxID=1099794 RepID=A0AA37SQ45_9BACT|nr:glycosyl hydrolase family 28 protein [Portibacter lacus]GLR17905.1 polygalacturonase [Portibacter lacus]
MNEYNILNFGAIGNGINDDSESIQKTIKTCSENGGGRVLIPGGFTFLSGPFDLASNIEFHVQTGAILQAIADESVYHKSAFKENKGEGSIWIGGEDLNNVVITGGGIIDGNGMAFMGRESHGAYELKPFDIIDPRPHILTLVGGHNIKVHNITFKDAAYWGLHFVGCKDVLISNISIYNNLKIRNGDGIDLDHCQNVNISNCHIESGDDCICFKNRREYSEYGPCTDITVNGCTLVSTSCAIKFGSENVDAIENVIISNCIIKNSNRGIGIQNRDEGTISNILISNIIMNCRLFSDVWWGKAEPVYITAFPRATTNDKDSGIRLPNGASKGFVGEVKDITITNIKCSSENGIFVGAEEQNKIRNIKFNNIDLKINKTTAYRGGIYDCRPCEGPPLVEEGTSGFYLMNVKDVSIHNSEVKWGKTRPSYFKEGITKVNCKSILVSNSIFPNEEHLTNLTIPKIKKIK